MQERSRDPRTVWGLLGLGLALAACTAGMAILGDLRRHTLPFLGLYLAAFLPYGLAVWAMVRQPDRRGALALVVGLAILFRVILLFTTPPTLSDDVYRYIWDGRLANAGISPYALPVNAPQLDALAGPQRALVNNDWMASPYLPVAQAYFALVYRLAPDSPLAFQVAAAVLDLLAGGLVLALLRRLALPATHGLIYLWNPLVVVEFAHGAHVDALMICLMMAALWALLAARARFGSAVALAAATLTKGLPVLLLPALARRWGWRALLVYGGLVLLVCVVFAWGPGWGLLGPLDGTGLLGALRIYGAYWNYNGGFYHWLEVALSGYPTPGAVPPEVAGWAPIRAARLIAAGLLGLGVVVVWWRSRRTDDDLALLRLVAVLLAAYMLLATTVHPWYVTVIVPLLPFLLPRQGEGAVTEAGGRSGRFLLPAIYFTAAVALSYFTYLDPANLREYDAVRLAEYLPLYLMLIWAAWPASGAADRLGRG